MNSQHAFPISILGVDFAYQNKGSGVPSELKKLSYDKGDIKTSNDSIIEEILDAWAGLWNT